MPPASSVFSACQLWMFSRVQDDWSVWRYKTPLMTFLSFVPSTNPPYIHGVLLCSLAPLRTTLRSLSQLTSGPDKLLGNPAGMIPANAMSHSDNTDMYTKLQVQMNTRVFPPSLSEQKIPFWPWVGIFQWCDIPKVAEEAALLMNALLSRLPQQSLSHMTSLNPGSSSQSDQAHNPAGFPVLPEKDERFHQGQSESQVKVLFPLGGQETLLDCGPLQDWVHDPLL